MANVVSSAMPSWTCCSIVVKRSLKVAASAGRAARLSRTVVVLLWAVERPPPALLLLLRRLLLLLRLVLDDVLMWTGRVIFSRCMRHLRTRGMMRLRICLERRSLREKKKTSRIDVYKVLYLVALYLFRKTYPSVVYPTTHDEFFFILFSRFLCHSARLLFF